MQIVLLLALGLTIGILSGILGIGGGVVLVPALVWMFGLKQPEAAAITLAVLAVPVTLPSVYRYYQEHVFQMEHLQMAACIAAAFAAGSYVGASVHDLVAGPMLRIGFGLVMIYIAVRFIISSDHWAANAAAGLTSMTAALVAYFVLRAVGRKHLTPPDLGQHIRTAKEKGHGDIEYHI